MPSALKVVRRGPFLIARFAERQRVASWAVLGGGLGHADAVAWLEVRDAELTPSLDPVSFLERRLHESDLVGAVGLLTSRRLDAYQDVTHRFGDRISRCVATVGLGNALRAGDPPTESCALGTINALCHLSIRLRDEALLEALALAAEAKALAVMEAGVRSVETRRVASGTGTDCIVIACAEHGDAMLYAGKHTIIGHLIGASVYEAVSRGVAAWNQEMKPDVPSFAAGTGR